MHRVTSSIVVVLSTLLLASLCSAQQVTGTAVPNLIRYGGTLKDPNGSPLVVTTGVTFAIYKQQDGGAPIWLETQNITPDANGQYSVLLGSATATGVPADLFSQEEQRWLGAQIQEQPEQARVLLVSVPYAFKAHEAETLAGRSVSDFVLAKELNFAGTTAGANSSDQTGFSNADSSGATPSGIKTAATTAGPTNFSGSTVDQIVKVTQTGTGNAIFATTSSTGNSNTVLATVNGPGVAIFGQANPTSAQAYGVEGTTASNIGIGVLGFATASTGSAYGVKGYANSVNGTGVRGLAMSATGITYGVSGAVSSPNGTGLWGQSQSINGGTGVWGQSLATTGATAGVLATAASNAGVGVSALETSLTGATYGLNATVQSPGGTAAWLQNTAGGPLLVAATGPINSPVTAFSVDGRGNVTTVGTFTGNGAGLTGVPLAPGSAFYIQNGTALQTGTNFNIDGGGTVGGILGGNAVNAMTNYQIGGNTVLSVGVPVGPMKNLFVGRFAGASNTGDLNLFVGEDTGYSNSEGTANTFLGVEAGYSNDSGNNNVYVGFQSGLASTGNNNVYLGPSVAYAGYPGDSGNNNTYLGYAAAYNNSTGSNNTYIGYQAGFNNGTGNSNVYLGSQGASGESNIIRIGTQGSGTGQQNAAFIAGIYGATSSSGVPVYINSNGQLGTLTSSLRFKENVRDMGDSTSALMKLRPVTFFYKPEYENGPRTLQFGLIAEEVEKVYPELVAHDNDGKPYTVRYQYIVSMLLNEVQKQYHRAEEQDEVITSQERKINQLEERLSRLEDFIGKQVYHAEAKMLHDTVAGSGARP
jgi:trimeric autotransporter adhesin